MIFSIIIPHKNSPKQLQRCLDSIPMRDDVEVIIVDDNSAPEIVDFDNFPGKDRPNTTVIFSKENGRQGRARNIALPYAKGKWLIFADADDYFTYCFNDVLNDYADSDADIVFLNICSAMDDTYLRSNRSDYWNEINDGYFNKDQEYYTLLLRYNYGGPWGKLVKKALVDEHQLKYEEFIPHHDDTRFAYLTGHYARSIKVDKRAVYCLTESSSSISYTMTDEKYLARMHVLGEQDRFIKSIGLDLDCTSSFMMESLKEIRNAGRMDLYERCLEVLEKEGMDTEPVRQSIVDADKQEKKNPPILRRFIRVVKPVLIAMLQRWL